MDMHSCHGQHNDFDSQGKNRFNFQNVDERKQLTKKQQQNLLENQI